MPITNAEHERNLKAPAVCELLPLRICLKTRYMSRVITMGDRV